MAFVANIDTNTLRDESATYPSTANNYRKTQRSLTRSFEKIIVCNIAYNSAQVASALKNYTEYSIRPYGKVFLEKYGFYAPEQTFSYLAKVRERCALAANSLFYQSKRAPPQQFKELLKQTLVKEHLNSFAMPAHLHKYFDFFFYQANLLYGKIQDHYKEQKLLVQFMGIEQDTREKFPKFAKILDRKKRYKIEKRYQELSMRLLDKLLTQGNSLERWGFCRFSQSVDAYAKEVLDELPPFEELVQELEQNFDETLLRRINFYEFLASTVSFEGIFEYSQGEEGQGSILGQGVCFGLCFEMAKMFWLEPESELTRGNTQTISASARIYQAYSDLAVFLPSCFKKRHKDLPILEGHSLIPEKLQRLAGVHRSTLASFFVGDQLPIDLASYFCSEMMGKEEPSCLLSISISEKEIHLVYIRFDRAKERYIFFDPNFGAFEKKGGSYIEGIGWLLATVISCVESYKGCQITLNHYALN